MLNKTFFLCVTLLAPFAIVLGLPIQAAVVVDTGQRACFDESGRSGCKRPGEKLFGQDAQYNGAQPSYRDNGDGTVSDLNTGLMWSQGLDGQKLTPREAKRVADKMTLGGYDDWRVPTIKELYSLIDFRGYTGFDGHRDMSRVPSNAVPYINTDYFDFAYGDTANGERYIDAQWLSSTHYVSKTMDVMNTVFGVNFADGRIKGYGYQRQGTSHTIKTFYVRYVRGKPYGENAFVDNGDNTITDKSTDLIWTRQDSGKAMKWSEALEYCATLESAGQSDWRLPNVKELQYIVDYQRSPDSTHSAAISPLFATTEIENEAGQKDFPFFWSSTTHLDGPQAGSDAAYVAFGRAIGKMRGRIMDVHGAGAQRSDPKDGRAVLGHGPQGDARRGKNYARCVRGGVAELVDSHPEVSTDGYPDQLRIVDVQGDSGLKQQKSSADYDSPRRLHPAKGPTARAGFVTRLDRDGDQRVSRREFDGPADRFDFHDRNHDGYLTEDEAPHMTKGFRPESLR